MWSKPVPIGETGEHQFGEPVDENDHGDVNVGFNFYPELNRIELHIGTLANCLYMSRAETLELATDLREVIKKFLPNAIPSEHQVIEITVTETVIGGPRVTLTFPKQSSVIIGTAESWLRMVEQMTEAAMRIRLT